MLQTLQTYTVFRNVLVDDGNDDEMFEKSNPCFSSPNELFVRFWMRSDV